MTINHRHLFAFHAVANELSFSRAARRLNVSQPTLSQQIKSLEARYRANLFEPRQVPLRLTPLGLALHRLTGEMFARSDEIELLLRNPLVGDGSLHIRLLADSPAFAASLTQALAMSHPLARLVIQIADAHKALEALLDGRADAVIAIDPQIDPTLVYKPLFTDRLAVVLPSNHGCAGLATFRLEQLADECLVIREPASRTYSATRALLTARDIQPARIVEMHSREVICEAVAIGLGVSLMFASECRPDPRLVFVPPDAQPPPASLTSYLVTTADQRRRAVVQAIQAAANKVLDDMDRDGDADGA